HRGVARRRLGDDDAAVGVTDEQDGAAEACDDVADVRRVARHAPQRVGDGDRLDAELLQAGDDAVPARRLGERAVHQHDRRLLDGGVHGILLAVRWWAAAQRPWRAARRTATA